MMDDRISKMRARITFQSESTSSDSGGGSSLSWADEVTVWAHIQPVSGRSATAERFYGGQVEDSALFKVTTRYISGIIPKMRILYGSRVFNIHSVRNDDELNQFLTIIAEEGVAV